MFREILSKIGLCLHNHSLPYMIIGGQAVLIYGEPRLTRDIDTVYIRKWLSEFDASADNNGFLKIFEDLMKS